MLRPRPRNRLFIRFTLAFAALSATGPGAFPAFAQSLEQAELGLAMQTGNINAIGTVLQLQSWGMSHSPYNLTPVYQSSQRTNAPSSDPTEQRQYNFQWSGNGDADLPPRYETKLNAVTRSVEHLAHELTDAETAKSLGITQNIVTNARRRYELRIDPSSVRLYPGESENLRIEFDGKDERIAVITKDADKKDDPFLKYASRREVLPDGKIRYTLVPQQRFHTTPPSSAALETRVENTSPGLFGLGARGKMTLKYRDQFCDWQAENPGRFPELGRTSEVEISIVRAHHVRHYVGAFPSRPYFTTESSTEIFRSKPFTHVCGQPAREFAVSIASPERISISSECDDEKSGCDSLVATITQRRLDSSVYDPKARVSITRNAYSLDDAHGEAFKTVHKFATAVATIGQNQAVDGAAIAQNRESAKSVTPIPDTSVPAVSAESAR